ncbi:MAG: hypothetical protein PUP92_36920 [Rhizonema sp. PD38]|nr:hypothetical protein [Rhizonema sp. PD38]
MSLPTYAFIASILIMLGVGLFQQGTGQVHVAFPAVKASENIGIMLILKAFAQGYAALTAIVNFVAEFEEHHPDTSTTVIIPLAVTRHWWEEILHNQTAFFLKNALQFKSQVAITTVRYYL